jgi:hypothetical protein
LYRISYYADRWQVLQHNNPTAGAWQVVHQSLPDHQRLSVELHRSTSGSVSATDARIEYETIGQTGKPYWRTLRTLRPSEVWLDQHYDDK